MRLTFHALLPPSTIPAPSTWQERCREHAAAVELQAPGQSLTAVPVTLSYRWHGHAGHVAVRAARPGDVADIFDDWSAEIRADYQAVASFDYDGDAEAMPGALLIAGGLAASLAGALVIESDGVFLRPGEIPGAVRDWEAAS